MAAVRRSPVTPASDAPKPPRAEPHRRRVHPRDDFANPERGVFSTRSAERPNPIGLHEVEVVAIEGNRILVTDLEALDGTPIVDVKPVI
jgi:tRNA-Thr(GGU) m(6)t(6)A37 methyltransferase TsaA